MHCTPQFKVVQHCCNKYGNSEQPKQKTVITMCSQPVENINSGLGGLAVNFTIGIDQAPCNQNTRITCKLTPFAYIWPFIEKKDEPMLTKMSNYSGPKQTNSGVNQKHSHIIHPIYPPRITCFLTVQNI